MGDIIAVGLSPTLQKTVSFGTLRLDAVNRSTGYRVDASGKAVNAARVIAQLGGVPVTAVCPLGAANASLFLELAARDGLAVVPVLVPGSTRWCYTLLEPGTGRATELVVGEPSGGEDGAVREDAASRLLSSIAALLPGAKALLLAGSRPPFWPPDICPRIVSAALDAGLEVLVDFHGNDLLRTLESRVPTVIKINEEEYCSTFGLGFPAGAETLLRDMDERSAGLGTTIVVTRGPRDTFASSRGCGLVHPVVPFRALNAIGCGDAFSGGFLHAWSSSHSLEASLAEGTRCAGLNAQNPRPGSIAPPDAPGEGIPC